MKMEVRNYTGTEYIRSAETRRDYEGRPKPGEVSSGASGYTDVVQFGSGARLVQHRDLKGKVQSLTLEGKGKPRQIDAEMTFGEEARELKVSLQKGALTQSIYDSGQIRLSFQAVPGKTLNSQVDILTDGLIEGWVHLSPGSEGSYVAKGTVAGETVRVETENGNHGAIGCLLERTAIYPNRVYRR